MTRSGFSRCVEVRAPGVELDDAELRQREIALGVLDREIGAVLLVGVLRFEDIDAWAACP